MSTKEQKGIPFTLLPLGAIARVLIDRARRKLAQQLPKEQSRGGGDQISTGDQRRPNR